MRPSVSVLIVAWNSSAELRRTLPPLVAELRDGDELIVVDNDSPDDSAAVARELAPAAKVVTMGRNRGFAGGANVGASAATGDLLVILNPDAMPLPGWGEAIRRPWLEGRGWSAWQGLVAGADGATINSAGNPVHFTGIVWAGMHDEPLAAAPGPRDRDRRLGGLPGGAARGVAAVRRLRRALLHVPRGRRPLAAAAAGGGDGGDRAARGRRPRLRVQRLERQQVALARAQPAGDAGPALPRAPSLRCWLRRCWRPRRRCSLAAAAGGWGGQKLRADAEAVAWLPRLLRERRAIQRSRAISAGEFAAALTADLDSPFIPAVARSAPARLLLRGYWRVVRTLL